ncbi:MAG TPA: tripartite tricarboxylate transporter TctB family protein [Paracoccaceae bacterium]|nr:tripartite tricarboxylate transporter TctB family protein [Paracoccaceae bacterium]
MRRAELGMALLLGLLSLYVMWKSGEPPSWNTEAERFANIGFAPGAGMGSGTWPFWLAAGMFLCCVWTVVNWFRRATPPSRSAEPFLDNYARRMLVTVGGGLVVFLLLIGPIGFYGGIFVFLLYYIHFLGRHSLVVSLAVAVAIPVMSFFFFDVAMRVVLPKGYLLEDFFVPLYDIFL